MNWLRLFLTGTVLAVATISSPHAQERALSQPRTLAPTSHPSWPRDLSQIWLAPERGTSNARAGASALSRAFELERTGDYSALLSLTSQAGLQQGILGPYATYYLGVAQLNLSRAADARRTFKSLRDSKPIGFLAEAAAYGEAQALLLLDQPADAVAILEEIVRGKPMDVEVALLRLGTAQRAAGERTKAAETLVRVYYEFALSDSALEAQAALDGLAHFEPLKAGSPRYKLELGRAERFFGARQYAAARDAFEELDRVAAPADKELIDLRIAESNYFLKRYRNARDGVRPYAVKASRQAEALYFFGVSSRDSGDTATFLQTSRRIADEFPRDSWAEQALNDLGTYYIKIDDDDRADAIFREMLDRFPDGAFGERAAWKAGWRAYRENKYRDTVRFFEQAAANYPRSDYRPSWLYWAGRAHEQLGEKSEAEAVYALAIADYQNSYYGRLTLDRLGRRAEAVRAQVLAAQAERHAALGAPAAPPANAAIVRALLAADMYDEAQNELRFARRVWGDSPAIQATIAWVTERQAREEKGMARLVTARSAMNTMRRAYPQILAAGGEDLPRDIQAVIFPLAYWDLIKKHSATRKLDPYLVAALVAQESTFVPDVRSHANAYGLSQLIPSTARQTARRIGVSYSSRLLTDPEANLRIGTAYFAEKIAEFGAVHLALASYNAGERPVRRWMAEKPGLERDEFIDDIPYPETQGYVRKILGTAEDYRRLYGGDTVGGAEVAVATAVAPAAAAKTPAAKAAAPKPKPRVTPAPRKPAAKKK